MSPKYSPNLECDGRRRGRRSGCRTTPRHREPSPTAEVGRELYARQGGPSIASPRGCWARRGTNQHPRLPAPWPQGRVLGRVVADLFFNCAFARRVWANQQITVLDISSAERFWSSIGRYRGRGALVLVRA